MCTGNENREYPPPEQGPRLLFFSGGTALKETARELTRYTHNSIHLITPFDSGGSSAALREAFGMPAVGDLRARIMTLTDLRQPGNPEACTLFAYRLPEDAPEPALRKELESLIRGRHPLLAQIPMPMRDIIREHLQRFCQLMPPSFSLAGANIGNLALTAGYLINGRRLSRVADLYSRLLRAKGLVRPTVEANAHLAVRLSNGKILIGQHRFTGKHLESAQEPIAGIWLTPKPDSDAKARIVIEPGIAYLIRSAQALCYPIGSFYSSVLANLLPQGIGRAVAASPCPKIFVPNLGSDPELAGHSLEMQVRKLLEPLLSDAPGSKPADMLTMVLVDAEQGEYPGGLPEKELNSLGIRMLRMPLIRKGKGPLADSRLLASALMAAIGKGKESR